MEQHKSTILSEVLPKVRADYGAGISEGHGKIIMINNDIATIEWEKEYPDEDALPTWREAVALSSIHETGWKDYYGSTIGIFYERN
tara:strand:+ start:720 stop:977 length:258 start_codon:yes stop_codon:yes gene_type:complete